MKKSAKNAALAFYHRFCTKNWAKIRENQLFLQKREYLSNIQTTKGKDLDWDMLQS